jgi:predicted ATPase
VHHKGSVVFARPDYEDSQDEVRLTQTYLEQIVRNRDFRDVAEFFRSVQYLHVVPQLMRDPERSAGRTDDPFGGDFLERVARVNEKTRKAWLKRIGNALRVAVPMLEEVEFIRGEKGTPHLRGKYRHWRPQGAWQDETQFSDGTLRLIGLLWSILEGSGPLLLEEPELSLHAEAVRHLPALFHRASSRTGRQIVLSTHSDSLLRDGGIGLDEVFMLTPGDEGTVIKRVADDQQAIDLIRSGFTMAEVVIPKTRPEAVGQLALFE